MSDLVKDMTTIEENRKQMDIIDDWLFRLNRMQSAHYEVAMYYRKLHMYLGVPTIIVTTIVGSAIFLEYSETQTLSALMQAIVVFLSLSAPVLTSLQTFLNFNERAEKHRSAGANHAELRVQLEVFSRNPGNRDMIWEYLGQLNEKWMSQNKSSPDIPLRIFRRVTARFARAQPDLAARNLT